MRPDRLIEEPLTRSIIGAFFEVYTALGFGFLENIYSLAIEHELAIRGHRVAREVVVRVTYKGEHLGTQRLDMVVDNKVVVELKSTQYLHPSAMRQVVSYLRGTELEVGLLLHFGPEPKIYRQILTRDRKTWILGPSG